MRPRKLAAAVILCAAAALGQKLESIDHLADVYNRTRSEPAAVALAKAKMRNDDREGALRLLRDFMQTNPDAAQARQLAAAIAASPELRLERVDKVLALQPSNAGLQVEKARLQIEAGLYAAALDTIRLVRAHGAERIDGLDELERTARQKLRQSRQRR